MQSWLFPLQKSSSCLLWSSDPDQNILKVQRDSDLHFFLRISHKLRKNFEKVPLFSLIRFEIKIQAMYFLHIFLFLLSVSPTHDAKHLQKNNSFLRKISEVFRGSNLFKSYTMKYFKLYETPFFYECKTFLYVTWAYQSPNPA